MRRTRALVGALAAMCAVAFVPRADALQMSLTRADLCGASQSVIVGQVSDIETLWAPTVDGGLERHAFVGVWQTVRGGDLPMAEVILPGGRLGEFRHWVEDVPELEVGAHYMLFLTKTPWGWEVIGGEAGAVQIAPNDLGKGETLREAIASLEGCHGR